MSETLHSLVSKNDDTFFLNVSTLVCRLTITELDFGDAVDCSPLLLRQEKIAVRMTTPYEDVYFRHNCYNSYIKQQNSSQYPYKIGF